LGAAAADGTLWTVACLVEPQFFSLRTDIKVPLLVIGEVLFMVPVFRLLVFALLDFLQILVRDIALLLFLREIFVSV
jgi:hypothetical protein